MNDLELQQKIRELFRYENGRLIWIKPPKNHMRLLGKSAGSVRPPRGYVYVSVDGKAYSRSRLVYLYHHGKFPRPVCDHINRKRQDDRIENLRESTVADNNRNITKINVRKLPSGRYQSRLAQRVIGTFDTYELAAKAYNNERRLSWSQ